LTGAGDQTLFFSDRPDRIVGTVETARFLDALGFTPLNPPNAAVVVRTPEGERDVLVVELFDPVFAEAFGAARGVQMTYEARILEAYQGGGLDDWVAEQKDALLPETFTDVSLFVDDCPDIKDCLYEFPPGVLNRVGPIPGGPYGRCWSWSDFNCNPCVETFQY